jgi:hypothetical protein
MREIPQCWLTGQAAGVAAAQAAAARADLRTLPISPLQRALREQGVVLRVAAQTQGDRGTAAAADLPAAVGAADRSDAPEGAR